MQLGDITAISTQRHGFITFPPGKSYGHKLFNRVESMNGNLCYDRKLSTPDLLNQTWHAMTTRFPRLKLALAFEKKQSHTPFHFVKLLGSKRLTGRDTMRIGSRVHNKVQSWSTKSVYSVDLECQTCSCGTLQENGISCQHVLQHICSIHGNPKHCLPDSLAITTWKNTYIENWGPISLGNISLTDSLCPTPSKQCAPAGRPQATRMETSYQRRKKTRQHQDPHLPEGTCSNSLTLQEV